MNHSTPQIGIVILAAGASTRMGSPKQLIEWQGQTLVRRITEVALATEYRPIVVVLGANKTSITAELEGLPVTLIENPHWEQGLSSSVKMGLAGVYMTKKEFDAVLFLLVDQPKVDQALVEHIIATYQENDKGIIACRYGGKPGVPALFDRKYVEELLSLDGDNGAKWVMMQHRDDCLEIPFEDGAIDLDTRQDVDKFLS
ncbi:hypothetical protein GCM10023189_50610 [Nibrella saemangeumensis]|uniref:MobA-like NTP transferase domain-containing protein n=1 Tax=Nibrella saemangeumensis TaxID=1084526 RepID=A0ABP8NHT5_9BACT